MSDTAYLALTKAMQNEAHLSQIANQSYVNKYNKDDVVLGYYLLNGVPTAASGYSYSHKIPVSANDVVRMSICEGVQSGGLFNPSNEHVVKFSGTVDEVLEYTVPSNAPIGSYIRYNSQTFRPNVMLTINQPIPRNYVSFESINTSYNVNPLFGKIITLDGDSVCRGEGYTGGYGKLIAERNTMTYENKALSGATITAGTMSGESERHWICRSVSGMRSDADYVLLEGGVNDTSLGVTLGEISSGYTATLDDTTFCGAVESLCKLTIARFPNKKIGFVIPHNMNYESFAAYYPSLITILKKWGVPYCDLYSETPPLNYIAALKAAYTKDGDGWHPNKNGYLYFYVPKIESWMKTL